MTEAMKVQKYPSDKVKQRFLEKGFWRKKIIAKEGKGRSERTKLSRMYVAVPPETGWPGGTPEANGYRRRGGK